MCHKKWALSHKKVSVVVSVFWYSTDLSEFDSADIIYYNKIIILTSSLLSVFRILTPYMLKHPNYFHFRHVPIDKVHFCKILQKIQH